MPIINILVHSPPPFTPLLLKKRAYMAITNSTRRVFSWPNSVACHRRSCRWKTTWKRPCPLGAPLGCSTGPWCSSSSSTLVWVCLASCSTATTPWAPLRSTCPTLKCNLGTARVKRSNTNPADMFVLLSAVWPSRCRWCLLSLFSSPTHCSATWPSTSCGTYTSHRGSRPRATG